MNIINFIKRNKVILYEERRKTSSFLFHINEAKANNEIESALFFVIPNAEKAAFILYIDKPVIVPLGFSTKKDITPKRPK